MRRVAADGRIDWEGFGMELRRIELEPGASADWSAPGPGERFAYVIAGAGTARAGGEEHPLAAESVLWLEEGEDCVFTAAAEGLAVLAARAPAGS